MTNSAITTNFAKTGNILINLAAKLPFDNVVVIEQSGKTRDFVDLARRLGAKGLLRVENLADALRE